MREIKRGDGYNLLRVAILVQAAQDYYNALRRLDKVKAKEYERLCDKAHAIALAESNIKSLRRFFKGEWCETLSDGCGEYIMRKVEQLYGDGSAFNRGPLRIADFY